MLRIILCVCFSLLFSFQSHSIDLWDPLDRMMLENIVEDAVRDNQMYAPSPLDIPGYAPPVQPVNKLKYFGVDKKDIKHSIFLESIHISKSGKGIMFYEGTESDFPRYEDRVTFFNAITGLNIDCDSKQIRVIGRRFYDINMSPIILNPKGRTNIEQFVKKYSSNFEKISANNNSFNNMYMKFICH